MKTPRTSRRPLFLLSALAAVVAGSQANAAFVIGESGSLFAPSFRGESNSYHFGWSFGGWDGNPGVTPDIIGAPTINPGNGASLTQGGTFADMVSSSGNVYGLSSNFNNSLTQLFIPTGGSSSGVGFTTIIIQGVGMAGGGPGGGTIADTFNFGSINGIIPEYTLGVNADGEGQFFAKWQIPGSAASFTVDLFAQAVQGTELAGVMSLTDLHIDTFYSATGYAPDVAVVPEPSSLLLSTLAGLGLIARRRRR